jgi:hypothetical protein
VLAALVAVAAALVFVVRAPVQRSGFYAVRGHRVFRVPREAVRGIDVVLEERRFSARRTGQGWRLDGAPASPESGRALDDLLEALVGLRVTDSFRSRDASTFGLDQPRASIEVFTPRGVRRLTLGAMNSTASALYARREGNPRILQIGALLLSELERVFYTRDRARPVGELGGEKGD